MAMIGEQSFVNNSLSMPDVLSSLPIKFNQLTGGLIKLIIRMVALMIMKELSANLVHQEVISLGIRVMLPARVTKFKAFIKSNLVEKEMSYNSSLFSI